MSRGERIASTSIVILTAVLAVMSIYLAFHTHFDTPEQEYVRKHSCHVVREDYSGGKYWADAYQQEMDNSETVTVWGCSDLMGTITVKTDSHKGWRP